MKLNDIEKLKFSENSRLSFDHDLSRLNWFNIGGKSKIYFFANSLKDLSLFLKIYHQRGKIFVLGAGCNTLFDDKIYDGAVIKLGKNFNNITKLNENLIISGSSCSDKKVSDFAMENSIEGFEFLSCIPGSIGGGIKMNAGCYGTEIWEIVKSVQTIDFDGNLHTRTASDYNIGYRYVVPKHKNEIFLSADLVLKKSSVEKVKDKINNYLNFEKNHKLELNPMRMAKKATYSQWVFLV